LRRVVWHAILSLPAFAFAQSGPAPGADFHARIQWTQQPEKIHHAPPAVVWLNPVDKRLEVHSASPGHFTLLQKNRTFLPHVLVIPLGSVVSFPNADPFFHNVFSLFNGKRFDLGLYEAGASKEVVFSREGVSYIFCDIHPEMSAVILTLSTPLYGIADSFEKVSVRNVPAGEYTLHVWVEGLTQQALDGMVRRVQVRAGASDSITLDATNALREPAQHLNKFGQPYDRPASAPY